MSTATTTSHDTGQTSSRRTTTQPTNIPIHQTAPNAAQRLRTTMAAVRLAFTWLGVRKTLAPEQRTTAARAFHADRELLSASKLILDTKNPAYRAVAAVRSEASGYWRTVTLPFPEAGIRLLPQKSLGMFASTKGTDFERFQEAAPARPEGGRTKKPAGAMDGPAGVTWRGQDSNLRPRGYEPRELPGCSTPRHLGVAKE